MAMKKRALQGIRVLDASTVIAGPTIGMLLADFGADVIKIEHPRGDVLRETGHQKDGVGLWFKMANRNKRCITMNFSTTEGAELLKKLIKTTDVLIENFRTNTMEKWGLGWDTLKVINPRLVMVRVTGFGQTGPYKMRPGFGTIAEAFSGFSNVIGEKKWAANTSKFWTCRWNSCIIWNVCDNVCPVLQRCSGWEWAVYRSKYIRAHFSITWPTTDGIRSTGYNPRAYGKSLAQQCTT